MRKCLFMALGMNLRDNGMYTLMIVNGFRLKASTIGEHPEELEFDIRLPCPKSSMLEPER